MKKRKKIVASLSLVCFQDELGLDMTYVEDYDEDIKPEYKKACETVFQIMKSSFKENIIKTAKIQNQRLN